MGAGEAHWARVEELGALGAAPDRAAAIAELTAVLDGDARECWHTRTAAIRALVAQNAVEAAPAILKLLARDRDPDTREAAIDALAALRFTRATRALERIADDEGPLAARARAALAVLKKISVE